MPNFENLPIETRSYVKSNEMISAKYRSTLLENQVMAIALTRIEENPNDADNPLEARLYPGELKKLVSDDAHIYRDLKALAKSITGHTMFLEDGKGNFEAFSVVPNANYQDGVFILKFNHALKEHLFGLERNFTTLELSVMTNFKKSSSFRIYELLKKDLFRSKMSVNNGRVDVEYNLFEFRFLIGIANSDNVHVQNRIKTMNQVDWEELYHVLEKNGSKRDIKFKTPDKLQKDCLRPAQEELQEKSDIRFEYELVRIGRPYKKIVFHIYPNKPESQSERNELERRQKDLESLGETNYMRQCEIPRDMTAETQQLYGRLMGHNGLTKDDIDILVKTAEYNANDVIAAVEYADKQGEVNNYMGYIIRCIQGRYFESQTIEVLNGSHEDAVRVRNLLDDYEREKTSGDIHERLLAKTKLKDDYREFEQVIASKGVSIEQLEVVYSAEEIVQMYADWKCNRPIQF